MATKSYKARGIVLNCVKYGESALIVNMLTDAYGRQSYIVQGIGSVRGRTSKMALFQPLSMLQFEGIISSKSDLHRLRDTQNAVPYATLRFDIRKSTIALFMAEVLYRLVGESERNSDLFDFVWGSVEALDALQEGVANFHLWWLANISRHIGFAPDTEFEQGMIFDMREGRFTAEVPLHNDLMMQCQAKLLHQLLNIDFTEVATLQLNRTERCTMLAELVKYYALHLESICNVRSIAILQEVF